MCSASTFKPGNPLKAIRAENVEVPDKFIVLSVFFLRELIFEAKELKF